MKTLTALIVLTAVSFTACNNSDHTTTTNSKTNDTAEGKMTSEPANALKNNNPIAPVISAYLQIKNGLAHDNGNEAAAGGVAFNEALSKVNTSFMNEAQKSSFKDIAEDAREMAEHIGKSSARIEHQREHFDMLSKDMHDLVKTVGTSQVLYQDFCPMYNNEKGASWLSETKEIQNPYLGKKMADCGELKEEIKQ